VSQGGFGANLQAEQDQLRLTASATLVQYSLKLITQPLTSSAGYLCYTSQIP
jgi:hypothetical protein